MSFRDMLTKRAEAERALGPKTPTTSRDVQLRGTGLTTRDLTAANKKYEKEVAASEKHGDETKDFVDAAWEASLSSATSAMLAAAKRKNIVLDESQTRAVEGMLSYDRVVLIGAAGTGKTTIEGIVVDELEKRVNVIDLRAARFVTTKDELSGVKTRAIASDNNTGGDEAKEEMPGIAFAAYTGRASQQMRRALAEKWQPSVSTIHSLLGYAPTEEEYEDKKTGELKVRKVFRPSFGNWQLLPYTVYVLDEASMIPIPLFNELVDAMPKTSRVILIGDIHQLPPVMGKGVLGYAMQKWPVFELTKIHRQAADNAIIANAHRVLQGKPMENDKNFHIIGDGRGGLTPSPPGQTDFSQYALAVVKKLADAGHYDPYRDTIIVPQNKSLIGTTALNERLVMMFNPEKKNDHGVIINKRTSIHTGTEPRFFAVGDKVMITSNINSVIPPITNGMIGIIESLNINGKYDMERAPVDVSGEDFDPDSIEVDMEDMEFSLQGFMDEQLGKDGDKDDDSEDQRQSSHVCTIKFDTGQSYQCSTAGEYRKITHGYAITCHKAQGGEYPNVVIIVHASNVKMLSQEWLYTALTRARNNVYIICNARGIAKAIATQRIKGYTIADKIKSYILESKTEDISLIDDPAHVDRNRYPILYPSTKIE